MRTSQRQLMREYLKKISENDDKEDALFQVIKHEKRTWFNVIDTVILVLILVGFVYAYTQGAFQKNEVIIDQTGTICTINGEPNYYNKTIADYGLVRTGIRADNLTKGVLS